MLPETPVTYFFPFISLTTISLPGSKHPSECSPLLPTCINMALLLGTSLLYNFGNPFSKKFPRLFLEYLSFEYFVETCHVRLYFPVGILLS